ncbi:alpha/beta fold hydrolase [Curvibacter sp. HBC28]|uniref:Alpha/beta fold hydrolase n=1 Tax=Curvibacter microcysteis TaxID=3026419 RepID=A0ABT5MC12_9BURK|nr:alpha/beta fold hydrolase [Curvibacter sp. HBC28]MDD0814113.1 alpha/beta fold hydrolase [Curvibacter sp. HBC28]
MSHPTLNYVPCPDATGSHRMAYWAWGDPAAAHVLVYVHGLARQGRDFDVLAADFVARTPHPIRIICPDVVGRGQSDWLSDPQAYQIPTYAADMLALLAQLQAQAPIQTLDWLGTSMGGLIGLALAGQPGLPLPVPLRRLVLNDVGPVIEWAALQRIGAYVGQPVRFADEAQAAAALWLISSSFGPHTPEQWLALSRPMLKPLPEGGLGLHYDPAIAVPFRALTQAAAQAGEAALWQLYDQVNAQTLVLRGAQSDLLSAATAAAMAQRGPRGRVVELPGVGHAPTLVAQDQRDTLFGFYFGSEA